MSWSAIVRAEEVDQSIGGRCREKKGRQKADTRQGCTSSCRLNGWTGDWQPERAEIIGQINEGREGKAVIDKTEQVAWNDMKHLQNEKGKIEKLKMESTADCCERAEVGMKAKLGKEWWEWKWSRHEQLDRLCKFQGKWRNDNAKNLTIDALWRGFRKKDKNSSFSEI